MSSKLKIGDVVKATPEAVANKICVNSFSGQPETYLELNKTYIVKEISSHWIYVEGNNQCINEKYLDLIYTHSYVKSVGDIIIIHGLRYVLDSLTAGRYFLKDAGYHGGNDKIFTHLKIEDRFKFVYDVVGYKLSHTVEHFPPVKAIKDINKVIHALMNYPHTSEKKLIGYRVLPKFQTIACKALSSNLDTGEILAHDSLLIGEAHRNKILDIWFEPVFQATETIVNMAGGAFKLKVIDNRIFHREEDITEFVRGLVNHFNFFSFGRYSCNIKNVTFSKTGCETAETTLEEWKKIYDLING